MKKQIYLLLALLCFGTVQAQWQSSLVKINDEGDLTYQPDEHNFILPDFSHAGYKGGKPIPEVNLPADKVLAISPLEDAEADNTAHIQAAINTVGKYPMNAEGFRGIVLLNPGKYNVDGTITIRKGGVILRGSGNGDNPASSTILYTRNKTAKAHNIIHAGYPKDARWGNESTTDNSIVKITTPVMHAHEYSFEVENVANLSKYAVGDLINIIFPTTDAWLAEMKYGGNSESKYWKTTNVKMSHHRYITKIEGTRITVDAPMYYTYDSKYGQPWMYKLRIPAALRDDADATPGANGDPEDRVLFNVGIENMRLEYQPTSSSSSFTGDQNCLLMCSLEDSWAKDLYLTGFVHAGIKTFGTTRSTIERCSAVNPSGKWTGGNMYNFESYQRSQLLLYKDCYAKGGRHHYIANGSGNVNGIVVKDMLSIADSSTPSVGISESHKDWAQGILFDNWKEETEDGSAVSGFKIGMYLRADMGSGHGWGGTTGIFWNCNVGDGGIYLDKVPTGQNYAIGCTAKSIRKYGSAAINSLGYVEGRNQAGLQPASLYDAQVAYRLKQEGSSIGKIVKEEESPLSIAVHKQKLIVTTEIQGILTLYTLNGSCLHTQFMESDTATTIHVRHQGNYLLSFTGETATTRTLVAIY